MVADLEVLAGDHAELFRRLVQGDLAEGADGGGGDALAAQVGERGDALMAQEQQGAAVDGRRDVDDVGAAQAAGDGRGAALVEVDAARDERLHGHTGREDAQVDGDAAVAEVAGVDGHLQRQ